MTDITDEMVERPVLAYCNAKRKRYGFEPLTDVVGLNYNLIHEHGEDILAALKAALSETKPE